MARTLEVAYIANVDSLERGNLRAGASTEAAAAKMAAANHKVGGSYVSMAGAGSKAAAELEGSHNRIISSMGGIHRSGNLAAAGIVAIGAAAYGVKKSADTLAEIATETRLLHNATGLNIKTASAYAAVAKAQDLPVKALNQAFGTLSKNLQAVENAHSGLTKSAHTQENAFKLLGLPIKDILKAHGDMNKLLPEVTKRFEEMPASQHKAAVGMALFGRGWQTLVPLMHSGALGLKEQLDVAQKMGATLSGSTSQQLKEFAKQQEASKYASLGLQLAIGQYLAPALTKLIHFLADTAHSLGEGVHWLKEHETAAKVLAGVITGTLGFALTVYVSSKAKAFINATKDMIGGMKNMAEKVGISAGKVDASMAGTAKASESAAGKVAASTAAEAGAVEANAGKIEATNTALKGSFASMATSAAASIAKIGGAVFLAVEALKGLEGLLHKITGESAKINELLGGNQPGESSREGNEGAVKGQPYNLSPSGAYERVMREVGRGKQHTLDTGGGIMAFFEAKGLTPAQAAGIVGNFQQESSLNPNMNTKEGRGLDSGLGSRAHGGTAPQQLEAYWKELVHEYPGVLSELKRAKSPQEAARIFSEGFEKPGKPEIEKRERYANRAFRAHPKAGQPEAETPEGAPSSPAHHAAKHHAAARVRAAGEPYANPFAGASNVHRSRTDQGVDFSFAGNLGAVGKGRIVNIVQDPGGFGTEIVEELTEGPHKGQFVYYGLETGATSLTRKGASVRAGQALARGKGSGGIELGFASGASGVPVTPFGPGASHEHATAGGKAFSSFLAGIGKGGSNLQLATAQFTEAAKRTVEEAAHLMLTTAQKLKLHGFVASAGTAHGSVEHYAERITGAEGALSANQARRLRGKQPLSSPAGASAAEENAAEAVAVAKAEKGFYQHELAALRKEAKAWAKLRDSYRSFARHAHGNAKKEALTKAAGYQAKVETASKDAKTLGGSIEAQDTKIVEAEAAQAALPAEIAAAQAQAVSERQSGDLSAYQAANQKIDAEVRAGLKTEAEGKAAKEANARNAIGGGYGALSDEGLLQVKGDLREFEKALTEATSAVEAHTNALKESAKALNDFLHASERLALVENGTILKAMADLISGQIGGVDYHGRSLNPGAGTAARY